MRWKVEEADVADQVGTEETEGADEVQADEVQADKAEDTIDMGAEGPLRGLDGPGWMSKLRVQGLRFGAETSAMESRFLFICKLLTKSAGVIKLSPYSQCGFRAQGSGFNWGLGYTV